jgi:hypothetical protein
MAELTQTQQNLIQTYSTYGEQELYNLLGNQLTEYGSESVREVYVFGTPNILERGKKYLTDTGGSFAGTVCPLRQEASKALAEFRQKNPDTLLPLGWT